MSRLVLFAVCMACLTASLALMWTFQRRLMYFPSGVVPTPASMGLREVDAVVLRTNDGLELGAWFFRTPIVAPYTVLVFSGNAGNRTHRVPLALALRTLGLQVLLLDYRGFGGNPGTSSEQGLFADGRAARDYLLTRADVEPSRVVYFGESLGTGVAVALAAEHPPAALILRSPFTSMTAVGQHHYRWLPVRWLLRDRFDAMNRIHRIHVPLLIVAGDADRVVPFPLTHALYESANEPKTLLVVKGADHNDGTLLNGAAMMRAIATLLGL